MKLELFTIFDRSTKTHSALLVSVNEMTAIRQVHNIVKNPQSPIGEFPEHYEVYEVGKFDEDSAEVQSVPKRRVGTVKSLMEQLHAPLKEDETEVKARGKKAKVSRIHG